MILFPEARVRVCHICGRLFSLTEHRTEPWGICRDCLCDLARAFVPFDLPRLNGHPDLPFIALSRYEGAIPPLMEAIKLRRHFRLLHFVASAALVPVLTAFPGPLVPLPASRRGRRSRGFDQSRLLAGYCDRPVAPVIRRRGGGEQKHLNREERGINAERSLRLRGAPPRGAIIIDDVTTTGASVHCAVTLLACAGAYPAAVVVVSARV